MTFWPELASENETVLEGTIWPEDVPSGILVLRCDECLLLFHRDGAAQRTQFKRGNTSIYCGHQCASIARGQVSVAQRR